MSLEQYEGKVFGGGGVKNSVVDGEVYVSLNDVASVLLQTSLGLALQYNITREESLRAQGRVVVDITALMHNLELDLKAKHGIDK